jgi:hypothetical protein
MGSYAIYAILFVIVVVGVYTYFTTKKKSNEFTEAHIENMEDIEKRTEGLSEEFNGLEEEEIYINLFVLYAAEQVRLTGRMVSSNRLSPMHEEFNNKYQALLGRSAPTIEKPYHKLKVALREKGFMVQPTS